jgi:hypothetical protein
MPKPNSAGHSDAGAGADDPPGGLRHGDLRRDRHRLGIESNARDAAGDGSAWSVCHAGDSRPAGTTCSAHPRFHSEGRHQVVASGQIQATLSHASHHRQNHHDLSE